MLLYSCPRLIMHFNATCNKCRNLKWIYYTCCVLIRSVPCGLLWNLMSKLQRAICETNLELVCYTWVIFDPVCGPNALPWNLVPKCICTRSVCQIHWEYDDTDNIFPSVDQMAPCCGALLSSYMWDANNNILQVSTLKEVNIWKFMIGSSCWEIHEMK